MVLNEVSSAATLQLIARREFIPRRDRTANSMAAGEAICDVLDFDGAVNQVANLFLELDKARQAICLSAEYSRKDTSFGLSN